MYVFIVPVILLILTGIIEIISCIVTVRSEYGKKTKAILVLLAALITQLLTYFVMSIPSPEIYPSNGQVSRDGTVRITTLTGLKVYYTLDANLDPKEDGIRYTEPIKLDESTTMNVKTSFLNKWSECVTLDLVVGENGEVTTLDEVNRGLLGDKIIFDSISDVDSVGNEIDFVSAQEADADGKAVDPHGTWEGGDIAVEDGKEYVVRLYVHNNNPGGTDAVATGTKVAVSGIDRSKTNKDGKQEVEVNGFIRSDNSTPKEYWDCIRFNSNTPFHLDYVYGSAMIYNRGAVGTTDPISAADIMTATDEQLAAQNVTGKPLSDDIVLKAGSEDGTLIGFDSLDGNVPGCYAYSSYVTIRVKAVYDK